MHKQLKMEYLENCFKSAKEKGLQYVGVAVSVPNGVEDEIIINPRENFDVKLEYYKKAYNNDLTLKSFNQIKITGFSYGSDFEQIENDLVIFKRSWDIS